EFDLETGALRSLDEVLTTFSHYRLLTFDRDPVTRSPTVEIAHEALIREWTRLREWLANSRESLYNHRRLMAVVAEWNQSGRDASFLPTGARLAQFEALVAEGDLVLNQVE